MNWRTIDTLLLDMDGTVLDLAFDNYFWQELVPRVIARRDGIAQDAAIQRVKQQYAEIRGTLNWYCLEHWSDTLDIDLIRLKNASSHRIRYLPGAREFLQAIAGRTVRMVLVTNAHSGTLEIKKAVSGLTRFFDVCLSAHDLGRPKEDPAFWPLLSRRVDFDPRRTLFIDDSPPVLAAARAYGLDRVLAVSRPDSQRPERQIPGFEAVEGIGQLKRTLAA